MTDTESAPDKPPPPKHPFTWERSIEITKVLATVWVALIGTIVTMQFNERQHELNRIEAIAKMLPHVASKPTLPASQSGTTVTPRDMSRDGAIWAIFRTANNPTMLRDLASLFPEDIYRVVSSIAAAGGLEHDEEAITALQVASEKLANKYSSDQKDSELGARLFAQAVRLKERKPGDPAALFIVDLSEPEVDAPRASDRAASLIASVIKLGDLHVKESESSSKINTGHWQAKQLYKRARQLGIQSTDKNVLQQVALADKDLAGLYSKEGHKGDAINFLKEALKLQEQALGKDSPEVKDTREKLGAETGTALP